MFEEKLGAIKAAAQSAAAQSVPVNPDFISLKELLVRVQSLFDAPKELRDAAILLMAFGTEKGEKPRWLCNSKSRGIVLANAQQAEFATARLKYVSEYGTFQSDDGNSASIEYELYGFNRKEFAAFLTEAEGEQVDLFGPIPVKEQDQPGDAAAIKSTIESTKLVTKTAETLAFEAAVKLAATKVFNELKQDQQWHVKHPKKTDMYELVKKRLTNDQVKSRNKKPTVAMITKIMSDWEMPAEPTRHVKSPSEKSRHTFKGPK